MLMNLVGARGFGLYPEELENAAIHTSTRVDAPDAIDEQLWDVSKHLTEVQPVEASARTAREVAERYRFLWDESDFRLKVEASVLWRQVSARIPSISERYPTRSVDQLSATLMRTCVMLEEKLRELAGSVALTHSTYYTQSDVVQGVAEFLATGQAPKEKLQS